MVKPFLLTAVLLGVACRLTWAQEWIEPYQTLSLSPEDPKLPFGAALEAHSFAVELPRSLAQPPAAESVAESEYLPFSLGLAGGYLRAKGSDRGTWTGGVQARLRLGFFAAEASVQVHESVYEDGDVHVTQYPVQLTAFLYIIPEGPIRPYILGGVGWYYTRFDYSGKFASIPNRTEHIFGEHLGAGGEFFLSKAISLDADVRYIFLNPTKDQVIGGDFNYWQITMGLNFFF